MIKFWLGNDSLADPQRTQQWILVVSDTWRNQGEVFLMNLDEPADYDIIIVIFINMV